MKIEAQQKIRETLDKLELKPSGSPFGTTTEQMIASFEGEHAISLPEDYRWFLVTYGASMFGKDVEFPAIQPSSWASNGAESLDAFLGLTGLFNMTKEMGNAVLEEELDYAKEIPIACSCGGSYICIGVGPANRGQVFFFNHEAEFEGECLTQISGSFHDFILSAIEVEQTVTQEELDKIKIEFFDDD